MGDWDSPVRSHNMFVPDWNSVAKGTSVSVVIDGTVFTDDLVMGISLPDHRPVRIFWRDQCSGAWMSSPYSAWSLG